MANDTVAGYFSNGDDAHRAINELLEGGFSAREIGAAFHCALTNRSSSRSVVEASDKAPIRSSGAADSTAAGAASGTGAVFPGGLSTGGGTAFAGASQPGPIPGGEIPPDLPRDIPSELVSDSGNRRTLRPQSSVPVSTTHDAAATSSETRTHESWWDKLKHVFGGSEPQTTGRREPVSDKNALDYGTGEGHLPLSSNYNYAYSGTAFESSFSGMGIPQERARRLSRELSRGGAVVTVHAGSQNSTAEAIIQRNNGVIRYESGREIEETTRESGAPEPRVEVYGEIHRVYPRYVPREDMRSRKAS